MAKQKGLNVHMKGRSLGGGITIFLSIIYLVLIVFSCSIVEVTRISIAKVQAERAMISASQSVLGGYDRFLKDQYGLFARSTEYADVAYISGEPLVSSDAIEADYAHYLDANLRNHPSLQRESYMDALVFDKPREGYWDLYQMELLGVEVKALEPLVDFRNRDVSYVKNEMLDFMALRVPLLFLQPMLEKMEAYEKVGKTGTFIEEKNKVVDKAAEIEANYSELYRLIEGLVIDSGTGEIHVVDENYIKRLAIDSKFDGIGEGYFNGASLGMYQVVGEQKTMVRDALSKQRLMLVDVSDELNNLIGRIGEYRSAIVTLNASIERVENEIRSTEVMITVAEEEATAEAVEEMSAEALQRSEEIRELKLAIVELEQEAHRLTLEKQILTERHRSAIGTAENCLENFESLVVGSDSYLEINIRALQNILTIQDLMAGVDQSIQEFMDDHSDEEDEVISGAYKQSMDELETIRQNYGFDENTLESINNLSDMRLNIEKNIEILEAAQPTINTYISEVKDLFNQPINSDSIAIRSYRQKETESFSISRTLMDYLSRYNNDILFDYSDYSGNRSEAQVEAQGLFEKLQSIVGSFDIGKMFEDIPPVEHPLLDNYPSSYYEKVVESEDGNVSESVPNIKELIYLNEYAVGMFSAYPDKGDDSQLTLTGYPKSSHVLDTEVEYILTGKTTSSDALRDVLLMIFAFRVVCNIIHLVTDSAKRTMILNLSNTIAGWWSLGAGAVIVTALISLLWASAESMVDLLMLVNNQKVPLIKMTTSWYTSLDGNMEDMVGLGAELAEKSVVKVIDIASGEVSRMITEVSGVISEETRQFYSEETERIYEEGMNLIEAETMLIEDEEERAKQLLEWTFNLDQQIIAFAENLNKEIEGYAEDGKEAASDLIHQKSQEFLANVKEGNKLSTDVTSVSGQTKSKGISLGEVVPQLSYHDYLRLFMFADMNGLEGRIYRMLDLIDMNLAYAHPSRGSDGEPTTRLKQYAVKIDAQASLEIEVGLFLLPFIQYRNKDGDSHYKFSVAVENGYE